MHPRLAPVLGLDRMKAHAGGLCAAVAAALADRLVDEDPALGPGREPPPSLAPELRRALLLVDEGRGPRDLAKKPLGLVESFAGPDVLRARMIAHDEDALDAFGFESPREVFDAHGAIDALAAGHRDRSVVQDLEGDIRTRGHRLTDGESAGVEEGAVTEVLEEVSRLGKRRHADPLDSFAAHVRDAGGRTVHRHRHSMTSDAGGRPGAFGNDRRAAVRTAGAEMEESRDGERILHRLTKKAEDAEASFERRSRDVGREALHQDLRDRIRVESAVGGDQDLLALVAFPYDSGARPLVVKRVLQKELEEGTLLFENDDLLEPAPELPDRLRLQRKGHAHLKEPNSETSKGVVVETKKRKGVSQVEVSLSRRRDADAIPGRRDANPVELIRAGERLGGFEPSGVDFPFEREAHGRDELNALRRSEGLALDLGRNDGDASGETSAVAKASATSVAILNPTQRPEARESSNP